MTNPYPQATGQSYTLQTLGNKTTFNQFSSSTTEYPVAGSNGPYSVFGPVILPKIYGKDLTAIEVASSGIIALSIYDEEQLIINSNVNTSFGDSFTQIGINASSTDKAITLQSGSATNKIVLDNLLISESNNFNVITSTKTNGLFLNNDVTLPNNLSVAGTTDLIDDVQLGST